MTREEAIAYWKPRYEHIIEFLEKTKDEPSIREYAEAIDIAIESLSANRPTVVHCRECVRKKNCWMFEEHKDDNGTCVWAEPYYVTEKPKDVVEQKNDVVAEQTGLISRAEALKAIDYRRKTANIDSRIVLDEVADKIRELPSAGRPSGEWLYKETDPNLKGDWYCDYCGARAEVDLYGEWILSDYCPNCGAKMGSD